MALGMLSHEVIDPWGNLGGMASSVSFALKRCGLHAFDVVPSPPVRLARVARLNVRAREGSLLRRQAVIVGSHCLPPLSSPSVLRFLTTNHVATLARGAKRHLICGVPFPMVPEAEVQVSAGVLNAGSVSHSSHPVASSLARPVVPRLFVWIN